MKLPDWTQNPFRLSLSLPLGRKSHLDVLSQDLFSCADQSLLYRTFLPGEAFWSLEEQWRSSSGRKIW